MFQPWQFFITVRLFACYRWALLDAGRELAVVGIDHATQQLHTGQCIRLNGSIGAIEVVEAV